MALFSKNKTKAIEDESIRDKSKFVVVGFTLMIVSLITLVGGEIFTSIKLAEQKRLISSTGDIEKKSNEIVLNMAKVGKEVNKADYEYAKEIMKFMSPNEFQSFKNSISGMASQFNVQINSLNEGKSEKLGKEFALYYIEYQFLSTFENLTFLKNKIAESNFKINIIQENVRRENPKSNKVIAEGKIGVYVYPEKKKFLEEKAKIIEKFEKEEISNQENKEDNQS